MRSLFDPLIVLRTYLLYWLLPSSVGGCLISHVQNGKDLEQRYLEDLLDERTETFTYIFTMLVQAEVHLKIVMKLLFNSRSCIIRMFSTSYTKTQ